MSNILYAGAARRVINPPLGIKTMGFSPREGVVQAIESDLTATALVLSNGNVKVAIVALDLCGLPLTTCSTLRRRIGQAICTPTSHVMLNFNHTHSAPAFPEWVPDTPEQIALQKDYQRDLLGRVVEAATKADQQLQEARLGAGWGECNIGIYRREVGPDGKLFVGEVPEVPIDPAVGVIRVDDLKGRPIATLFSYGCHTVVVGPRSLAASPDFPGPARKLIETSQGGLSLFLQGCGGNIMPKGGIGYEVDCSDASQRIGTILGSEVLKTASTIRTHVRQGERTSLGSLSKLSFWPWIPVTGDTCTYLGAVDEVVSLDFVDLPTLEVAQQFQNEWQQALAQVQSRQARDWEINVTTRFADWADKLVQAIQEERRTLDVAIQAIRVNDVVLATLSVEAFFETGLTIKNQSPFAHTQVLGYSNGLVCYLPRAEDFPPGGWDINERYGVPDLLFQAYSLPVAIHPNSEQRVVERTLKLIQQLV